MYKNMSDYSVRIKRGAVYTKINLQVIIKKSSYSIVALIIKHLFGFVKAFLENLFYLKILISLFHHSRF